MARLTPLIFVEKNSCINCKVCEIACHAWHYVEGHTVGTASGPVLPKLYVRPAAQGIIHDKCDLCLGRAQGAICIEACPEGALRLIDPQKDKYEKNLKAARNIAGIRRNG